MTDQPPDPTIPTVTPKPVPLHVAWAAVPRGTPVSPTEATAQDLIVLQVSSPTGVSTYFLDHGLAKQLAEGLLGLCSNVLTAPAGLAAALAQGAKIRFGKG